MSARGMAEDFRPFAFCSLLGACGKRGKPLISRHLRGFESFSRFEASKLADRKTRQPEVLTVGSGSMSRGCQYQGAVV